MFACIGVHGSDFCATARVVSHARLSVSAKEAGSDL